MLNPILEFVKNIWSKWNIQIVVLTSLFLQITLIFLSPLRKRTKNNIVLMLVWFTYLFADYTANFCIGLISNKYRGDEEDTKDNNYLIAFWAPFLLLHLGGPDTITAFSMEDNELWLRHMLGLIVQVCLTAYVFVLTLPTNTFWLPTALVFLAGIIKFSERTRSLQLASIRNFQQSSMFGNQGLKTSLSEHIKKGEELIEKFPPRKDDDELDNISLAHKKEHLDDVRVVSLAYLLFNKFKGLIVDTSIHYYNIWPIGAYFDKLSAIDALRVVEVELNLIYDAFYTKASLVHNKVGFFFRLVSLSFIVVAFVIFVVFNQKHGCNDQFNVKVTYTLLCGAVALDVVSLLMIIFSDHTFASLDSLKKNHLFWCIRKLGEGSSFRRFLKLKRPKWLGVGQKKILCRKIWCRRWSESISGFNFISYCLHKRKGWVEKTVDYIGARGLEQWTHEEKNPILQELWIFIFMELQRKYKEVEGNIEAMHRICLSRGAWVIQKDDILGEDLEKWKYFVDVRDNQVSFEQSIIRWHIATTLLFYADDDDVDAEQGSHENDQDHVELHRDFSKFLSDYMLYLLVRQPTMMSAVKGIGFDETWRICCDYAIEFFHKIRINPTEEDLRILPSNKNSFSKDGITGKFNIKQKEACKKFYDFIHTHPPDSTNEEERNFHSFLYGLFWKIIMLTEILKELKRAHRWNIIAQVWVELLSYAATNCRSITHVQQLGKGGEFISLVWLLMTHFGLGKQFQLLF